MTITGDVTATGNIDAAGGIEGVMVIEPTSTMDLSRITNSEIGIGDPDNGGFTEAAAARFTTVGASTSITAPTITASTNFQGSLQGAVDARSTVIGAGSATQSNFDLLNTTSDLYVGGDITMSATSKITAPELEITSNVSFQDLLVQANLTTLGNFDLGPDRTICLGDSTLLNAGEEWESYSWSTESQGTRLSDRGGVFRDATNIQSKTAGHPAQPNWIGARKLDLQDHTFHRKMVSLLNECCERFNFKMNFKLETTNGINVMKTQHT